MCKHFTLALPVIVYRDTIVYSVIIYLLNLLEAALRCWHRQLKVWCIASEFIERKRPRNLYILNRESIKLRNRIHVVQKGIKQR